MHDQIIATHVVFRGVSGDYPESERTQESRIINKYNPLRLVVVWFLCHIMYIGLLSSVVCRQNTTTMSL